jgi:uncharacterized protein (UPF0276 family)
MTAAAPLVGLLYNPAVPAVLDAAGELVDFVEVIPDRLWYDFGAGVPDRFSHAHGAIAELRRHSERHAVIGHGIGLSLPSVMPLDEAMLDEVVASHRCLDYRWYSEHLSMFLTPGGSVPNAQAGMGLPMVHDAETLEIVGQKVRQLQGALDRPILLENGTIFSVVPDPDMSEPDFMNRLHAETGCGMLLDLHNLYANTLNIGWDAQDYLRAFNPEIVVEIHLAGGDWLQSHYTDSHSRRTPGPVWDWLLEWGPRFPNLAAITFEYHESYHQRIGLGGVIEELEMMQGCASQIALARASASASASAPASARC